MAAESSLAVVVPAAEPVVGTYRARYDPSAAEGVPAHLTVLYPFMPPAEIDSLVAADLGSLFLSCPAFSIRLEEIKSFPGVLYLAPDPEAPFRDLTHRITARYPAYPPYGGLYADPTPHLTVGHAEDPEDFARLRADFTAHAAGRLPIRARVTRVTLLENQTGRWRVWMEFPLGVA